MLACGLEDFHQVWNVSAWHRPHWGLLPVSFSHLSDGGTAVAAGGGGERRCQGCAAAQGFSNMGH